MKKLKQYCTKENLGLVFNTFGAILIAIALGELPCAREGTADGGITGCTYAPTGAHTTYRIVYFLNHKYFYLGIILLIIGFALQLRKK